MGECISLLLISLLYHGSFFNPIQQEKGLCELQTKTVSDRQGFVLSSCSRYGFENSYMRCLRVEGFVEIQYIYQMILVLIMHYILVSL